MSEYRKCEVYLKDREMLVEALEEIGVATGDILERENEPNLALNGVGVSNLPIDILIKGAAVNATHDVGFVKEADGYKAYVYGGSAFENAVRTGKLQQCYAKRAITRVVQTHLSRAQIVREYQQDGKIGMRVRIPDS